MVFIFSPYVVLGPTIAEFAARSSDGAHPHTPGPMVKQRYCDGMRRSFATVDVFGAAPFRGNPVAVVLDADGLDEEEMRRFANWTNLSETTFVLTPTHADADYRLRIFTPSTELPFAGHPTLGSAHAWIEAQHGFEDRPVIQECGAGLVTVRRQAHGLAFAAPPLVRSGDVEAALMGRLVQGLGIDAEDVLAAQWVDNGPGWVALQLRSAEAVLAVEADARALGDLKIGLIGASPADSPEDFEVRAFAFGVGVTEDPVTGSLNAGLGQWLISSGRAPERYVARQGTRLGRHGIVRVDRIGDDIWVGGATTTLVSGSVEL